MTVRRLFALIGAFLFTSLSMWTYAESEERLYGPRFRWHEVPWQFMVFSFVLALAPIFWLPMSLRRPSQVCYWFLYVMVIVPCSFLPFQVIRVRPEEPLFFMIWLVFCFGLVSWIYRWPLLKFPKVQVRKFSFELAMVIGALALIAATVAFTGVKLDLSLKNVYVKRFAARESAPAGSVASYIFSILGNSIAPLLFGMSLIQRSLILFGVSMVGLITVFSLTGLKSTFFTPLLMAALYWVVMKHRHRFGPIMIWSGCFLAGLAALERAINGTSVLTLMFMDRLCFTPGMLSSFYWDFFSRNPHVYLADSFLAPFIHYPYDRHVGPLIGKVYFQNDNTNATTGVWAQGYAHFGYLGMFMTTVGVALFFWIFDSIARERKIGITAMMMGLIGVFWANVALHSSIVSQGLLLTMVCLYLMPTREAVSKLQLVEAPA